jgi:hypothetical protein
MYVPMAGNWFFGVNKGLATFTFDNKTIRSFIMNKLSVSIALAVLSVAAHAQNMGEPLGTDLVAASAVSRFVDHPYNCKQMLGGSDDGDLLPTSYGVALDASLNEIKAPVDQALARIYARCAQRVERVSDLNRRGLH